MAAATFRYNRDVNVEKPQSAGEDASRRSGWSVRRYVLGREPGDDLSASTTPEERLAMMWPLALEAWTLTGSGVPEYDRREAIVRVLRRGPA